MLALAEGGGGGYSLLWATRGGSESAFSILAVEERLKDSENCYVSI